MFADQGLVKENVVIPVIVADTEFPLFKSIVVFPLTFPKLFLKIA